MFLNPFDVPKNMGEVGGGKEVINFMVIRHLKCKAMHALVHRLSLAHPQAQPGYEEWGQTPCTCCLLEIYAKVLGELTEQSSMRAAAHTGGSLGVKIPCNHSFPFSPPPKGEKP